MSTATPAEQEQAVTVAIVTPAIQAARWNAAKALAPATSQPPTGGVPSSGQGVHSSEPITNG